MAGPGGCSPGQPPSDVTESLSRRYLISRGLCTATQKPWTDKTTGPCQPNNPASSSSPQCYLLKCVKVSTKQVVKARVLVNQVDFTSQETF